MWKFDEGSKSRKHNKIEEFFLEEYRNIAAAHFKSNETISEFFKSYLTIFSIPITIAAVLLNFDFFSNSLIDNIENFNLLSIFLGILLFTISFIGLFFYLHILNLHHDSILYARTINGIRRYFLNQNQRGKYSNILNYLVLPISISLPSYRNTQYFLPISLAFSFFNTFYFSLSTIFIGLYLQIVSFSNNSISFISPLIKYGFITFILSFFVLHFLLYLYFSRYREFSYLKSNFIGIDIDGVINDHKKQFSDFLFQKTGKKLLPEEITNIPVREILGKEISRDDEGKVFNDPDYWIKMPVIKSAVENIRSIKNSYSLKVFIFTQRGWPNQYLTRDETLAWKVKSNQFANEVLGNTIISDYKNLVKKYFKALPLRLLFLSSIDRIKNTFYQLKKGYPNKPWIDKITRAWLKHNNIDYDFLLIEKSSEYVKDSSAHIINRFFVSQNQPIRFFVEDDLIKAKKLSFICEYVFLIDQPYNQDQDLPENILRVNSWDEINKKIREIW